MLSAGLAAGLSTPHSPLQSLDLFSCPSSKEHSECQPWAVSYKGVEEGNDLCLSASYPFYIPCPCILHGRFAVLGMVPSQGTLNT